MLDTKIHKMQEDVDELQQRVQFLTEEIEALSHKYKQCVRTLHNDWDEEAR